MSCGDNCACAQRGLYPIQLVKRIQHDAYTYSFDFISLEPYPWKEGDSTKLNLIKEVTGKCEKRHFSVATLPDERIIRFTTRLREPISEYKEMLMSMREGDFAEVFKATGNFYLRRSNKPALLLSNGVGIATVRPMVMSFQKNTEGISQLTSLNVDRSGKLFEDEFIKVEDENEKFRSIYTSSRENFFIKLRSILETMKEADVYVVGSDAFVEGVRKFIKLEKLPFNRIFIDKPKAQVNMNLRIKK